jgi:hypothetical protein
MIQKEKNCFTTGTEMNGVSRINGYAMVLVDGGSCGAHHVMARGAWGVGCWGHMAEKKYRFLERKKKKYRFSPVSHHTEQRAQL